MSWPRVKLSDVATINPRLPRDVDESQQVTFVAMASASEDGHLLASEARVLSETKKGFTYFDRSDVLLAKITPCFENGKCLRPGQIPTEIGFGSTEFHVIRPDTESLDSLYLFYLVWSEQFRFLGEKSMSGAAGQKRVGSDFLKGFEIPLPPLPEQKRIAAILDKADAIRRKRQQAIQLADDFLRAVFLDMFGDPVTNPKGWNVVELSTLVDPDDKLNYGVVQPGDHEEDGVPLVRSGDLSDVTPDVSQLRRVSSSIDSKHRKSKLKGNEILIACVGTIGRVGWVSEAMIGWNIARAVTRIPIREGVNREYVYRYLQNPVVQGYFERETRAVAQPTLNVGLIAKTPVALPPHDLQLAFLERYRTIQAYKERLLVALGAQDELAGCLSQRAFAGQL
ncbi:restriction endonuclease subunit S [Stutzerimonas nitrititolerans]|uniref:restriction endonuclease subunit S n=1 Tax=Stutzerimonas nitrititolerans TaxID=2482751 RepID=UPI001BDC0FDE|nr:restriction endonuclease subunit S [Stutzerimonas nitrititolerans]MBT1120064.1 restriction endonuclease subunit S [Stutzerimonas nitrititolerans]